MKNNNQKKRERFEIVAAKRVQKTLDCLETLSKCSNRNNYEYTERDVQKMFKTIKVKMKNIETLFEGSFNNKKDKNFKF